MRGGVPPPPTTDSTAADIALQVRLLWELKEQCSVLCSAGVGLTGACLCRMRFI